jgi:hypothetical protein
MTNFKAFPGVLALASSAILSVSAVAGPNDSVWIQLFNPKDTNLRNDWDIKIRGEALNVDSRRTFRWAMSGADTTLEVSYENYTGSFGADNGPFGHIWYKHRTFSHYLIRAEHHFFGNQVSGGPSWAVQNNGLMLHAQSAASMGLNQDFPRSLEAQLQGPGSTADNNSTMNLCTPGTGFSTTPTGATSSTHCQSATNNSRGVLAPAWQTVSALMMGDSIGRFYVGTQLVLTFYKTVYLTGNIAGDSTATRPSSNIPWGSGYITLQAESHGTRFRRVEVLNLEGCMTPADANYKTYFVKHDSTACNKPAGVLGGRADVRASTPMRFVGNAVKVGGSGFVTLQVFDLRGNVVARHTASAPFQWTPSVKQAGMHVIRAITPKGTYTEKAALF